MRTFVRFLNFIVVFFITGIIYWYQFKNASFMEQWNKFIDTKSNGIYVVLFISGLLVILNIYTIFHTLKQLRKRKRAIEITNDNGTNSISIDAVQKKLSDMLNSNADIIHPKLYLELGHKNKPIHCDVEFGLKCTQNITGRTDDIKAEIISSFNNMIPNGPGVIVKASIVDIEGDGSIAAPKADTVFSGPVYPNEQDDDVDEKELS